MELRRTIPVEIIPGVSLTRLHLAVGDPMFPDDTTEVHVAHHSTGDLNEDAQWYNIYEHPDQNMLNILRESLHIDEEDWKIVEHMLGSFRWVLYRHSSPSEIRVDEQAMRGQEWTTTYF